MANSPKPSKDTSELIRNADRLTVELLAEHGLVTTGRPARKLSPKSLIGLYSEERPSRRQLSPPDLANK